MKKKIQPKNSCEKSSCTEYTTNRLNEKKEIIVYFLAIVMGNRLWGFFSALVKSQNLPRKCDNILNESSTRQIKCWSLPNCKREHTNANRDTHAYAHTVMWIAAIKLDLIKKFICISPASSVDDTCKWKLISAAAAATGKKQYHHSIHHIHLPAYAWRRGWVWKTIDVKTNQK